MAHAPFSSFWIRSITAQHCTGLKPDVAAIVLHLHDHSSGAYNAQEMKTLRTAARRTTNQSETA